MQDVTIRPATAGDVPVMLRLIRGLAEYERAAGEVAIGEAELLRDGFGDRPAYECLIGELGNEGKRESVGLALFFPFYSTWKGPGIHLEDLFVLPSARGSGVGKALLTAVAALAAERGCARLQWHVLDWNQPAIEFYQSLGAKFLDEWRIMRVTGDALEQLGSHPSFARMGHPHSGSPADSSVPPRRSASEVGHPDSGTPKASELDSQ